MDTVKEIEKDFSGFVTDIAAFKPNIKPVTVGRYASNISKILRETGLPYRPSSLNEKETIDKYLNGKNPSTQKAYLNALIVGIQATMKSSPVLKDYQERRDNLNANYFRERKSGEKNKREKANMITIEEWDTLIDTLNKRIVALRVYNQQDPNKLDYNLMLQHLIILLYRNYPLRNDFAMMKVVTPVQYRKEKHDMEYNYLILGYRKCTIILNNYKTNKVYGTKEIDVSNEVCKFIRRWQKVNKNPEFLLSDYNGVPFTRNRLSKFLVELFAQYTGKRVGTQILRKSFLTSKYGDVVEDMKEDAEIMGHSTETQQQVYVRKKD